MKPSVIHDIQVLTSRLTDGVGQLRHSTIVIFFFAFSINNKFKQEQPVASSNCLTCNFGTRKYEGSVNPVSLIPWPWPRATRHSQSLVHRVLIRRLHLHRLLPQTDSSQRAHRVSNKWTAHQKATFSTKNATQQQRYNTTYARICCRPDSIGQLSIDELSCNCSTDNERNVASVILQNSVHDRVLACMAWKVADCWSSEWPQRSSKQAHGEW